MSVEDGERSRDESSLSSSSSPPRYAEEAYRVGTTARHFL